MIKNEAGNVLFLILIAVALFAALSFAITSTGRNNASNINEEDTTIQTANLLGILSSYKPAVDRLLIINKCEKNQISFKNSLVSGHLNLSAPSDNSCHVFRPEGAGAVVRFPDEKALDPAQSGEPYYGEFSFEKNNAFRTIQGSSTYSVELTIPYVKEEICAAINKKLFDIDTIPEANSANLARLTFIGGFSNGGYYYCNGSELGNSRCGDTVGCYKVNSIWGSSQPAYVAYSIVLVNKP